MWSKEVAQETAKKIAERLEEPCNEHPIAFLNPMQIGELNPDRVEPLPQEPVYYDHRFECPHCRQSLIKEIESAKV